MRVRGQGLVPLLVGAFLIGGVWPVGAGAGPRNPAPRASRGCTAVAAVAPGVEPVETTSGGESRTYFRHVPPAYDGAQPLPVVIDLHGYLEGAQLHEANSMLGAFGATHGFVTLTPQGLGVAAHWDVELDAPDVRFVGDLIDEAKRTLCVDRRRIFVTGYSNGAFLASTLACVYADGIAAIAPVAGLIDPKGCRPSRPVPVLTFHGTGDDFVAYDGGLGTAGATAPASDGTDGTLAETSGGRAVARRAATPKVVAAWAQRNGCARKPTQKVVAPDVTRISYRCPDHADVELYRLAGAGHTWPGSDFSRAIAGVLGPTASIDASAVMWDFFEAHPLR